MAAYFKTDLNEELIVQMDLQYLYRLVFSKEILLVMSILLKKLIFKKKIYLIHFDSFCLNLLPFIRAVNPLVSFLFISGLYFKRRFIISI